MTFRDEIDHVHALLRQLEAASPPRTTYGLLARFLDFELVEVHLQRAVDCFVEDELARRRARLLLTRRRTPIDGRWHETIGERRHMSRSVA